MYEYKVLVVNNFSTDTKSFRFKDGNEVVSLYTLGRKGWELKSYIESNGAVAIFARRVEETKEKE